eukprot:4269266-Pleurochrysis_carterae.AAC.1
MTFNVRGERHHVKHSCRSVLSDPFAGDIPYVFFTKLGGFFHLTSHAASLLCHARRDHERRAVIARPRNACTGGC